VYDFSKNPIVLIYIERGETLSDLRELTIDRADRELTKLKNFFRARSEIAY
jgi:hypothetical protein